MKRYRSKPTEVMAVQFDGANWEELSDSPAPAQRRWHSPTNNSDCFLLAGKDGAQGWVHVPKGHWIVWDPEDLTDFWPVEDAYFTAKYEEVES